MISRPPIEAVRDTLAAIRSGGTFAVGLELPAEHLHVTVEGLGLLPLPMTAAMAKRLAALARPAPYGLRDQTLVDSKVRRTGELSPRLVHIDVGAWNRALGPALGQIRDALGLPTTGRLVAKLDKMLVYEPGGFFAPHRDSEKVDGMLASLVVVLPSKSTGGALVVTQGDERVELVAPGATKMLSLFAFYADCPHEVRPLETGYRVVLTYTLRFAQAGKPPVPVCEDDVLDQLTDELDTYFQTAVAPAYGSAEPTRPERFVCLLDHSYTQRGLSWDTLKNGDRGRALALREIAARLDYEVFLAQAEIHEQWNCDDPSYRRYGRSGRGRPRYGEDGEVIADADADDREPTLLELCSSEVDLRHWVDVDGNATESRADDVDMDEICALRPSSDLAPVRSEHEGYMGNYGNTCDRWYHRAAVVLWPRERAFYLRAKHDSAWAIAELSGRLAHGQRDEVLGRLEELQPVWKGSVWRAATRVSFAVLLGFVERLADKDRATVLFAPFGFAELATTAVAKSFGRLVGLFGAAWAGRVFEGWTPDRPAWDEKPAPLSTVCAGLLAGGTEEGRTAAVALLERQLSAFLSDRGRSDDAPGPWPEGHAATTLPARVVALLSGAAVVGSSRVVTALAETLVSTLVERSLSLSLSLPTAERLLQLAGREGGNDGPAAAWSRLGLDRFVDHVRRRVDTALAAPPRAPGDWSIVWPSSCKCELCRRLDAFLADGSQRSLAWPLARDRRQHIHGAIALRGLPVSHVTRREGSPQVLVLTKLAELHAREASWRARLVALQGLVGEAPG